MNEPKIAAACAAATLSLPGCAGLDPNLTLKTSLEHIETCDRTYTGRTGFGAALTFNISCKARPAQPAETPAPAAP